MLEASRKPFIDGFINEKSRFLQTTGMFKTWMQKPHPNWDQNCPNQHPISDKIG